jgi:Domain of unknown function (DUF6268)
VVRVFLNLLIALLFSDDAAADTSLPFQQPAVSDSRQIGQLTSPTLSHAFGTVDSSRALLEFDESPVPKFKQRALQKVSISGGWLGATKAQDLSSSFANVGVTLGMPLGSMDNLLAVTPNMRTDWISADRAIEIPTALYDVGLEFFHTRKFNERWKTIALVRPAHRSDFKTKQEAMRVFGLGVAIWDYKPNLLALSFGAVYLGRSDISALPVAGLTWTPNTRNRLELQFPRTRILHRLKKQGAQSELWSYLTAGIGGNTWAVTRASGQADQLALRDLRLTVGLEKLVAGGGGWFAEAGLAVDRSLEYLSDDARVSLSNGVILSAGWTY